MKKTLLGLILTLLSLSIWANENIEISNVSMPEIPPVSPTAAIYFTLHNHSDKEITLINVTTKVAHHAMVHLSQEVDGIAKMQHISEVIIPANGQFEFSNKGYHIMLMGLDKNLLSLPFDVQLEFNNQPAKLFVVGK